MRVALGITIATAVLGVGLSAQLPSAPGSALAHIDAVVTNGRGMAVRNLKADDFTIVEDGVAEKVETATFVAADAPVPADVALLPIASRESEQAEATRPGARVFAIFLDEYHVAPGEETERAKDLVTRFIEHDLGPRDLAVVLKPLDSLLNVRLTRDREELLAVVSTFEGRKGDYTPRNTFEQNYVAAAPVRIEAVRAQIVMSALDALTLHIGALQPGRKTLVVVSDGFARVPRRRDDPLPTAESVARNANRVGTTIYSVDPRALGGSDSDAAPSADTDAEHQSLKTLAEETDGRVIFTVADVAAALPHLSSDSDGYYLLTFRPAHPVETRTFHDVTVQLKPANLVVHARKGYWSASPDEALRAREARRAAIPVPPPQPMRHVSPFIQPWFGVARAENAAGMPRDGAMLVSFVWNAAHTVPGDRSRRGPPALVSMRATRSSDGALVFAGDVRPTSTSGRDSDIPSEVAFSTAPGRLLVQLQIQDADANVLDTDVRDVIVGGLAGPVEVGTPEVFRARSAREFRTLEAEPEPVPAAERDFTRSDHLLVRLPVYGGDAPLTVEAKVSSKPGNASRPLPIAPMPGTSLYQTDVSLAALVVGNYSVTVTAKGPDGDATGAFDFRIVP